MKKSLQLFLLFIFAITLLPQNSAVANDLPDSKRSATNYEIASALQQLVREVDSSAYVAVKVIEKNNFNKNKIYGNPFLLNYAEPPSISNNNIYEKLFVTIFTVSGRIPSGAQNVLRIVAESYAEKVEISIQAMPPDFIKAREALAKKQAPEVKPIETRPWETKFTEGLNQFLELSDNFKSIGDKFIQIAWKNAKDILLIILVSGACIFLIWFLFWFGIQRRRNSVIATGLSGLKSALETSPRGPAQETRPSTPQGASTAIKSANFSAGNDLRSLNSIPEEGLLSLLADCYWSSHDSYGAFLWRRINVERKIALLERMPALNDYGRFLGGLEEENLGMDQDPSYLRPLPIWHLDMTSLTHFVREHPEVISRLSPMRISALNLRTKERIYIFSLGHRQIEKNIPEIPEIKSPERQLKQSLFIEIQSPEDELEIISTNDLPVSVMAQIPSLGWLFRLPENSIAEILKSLTARDLASAWVGPKVVLDRLSQFLGPKKFELLQSQLERVTPSRESPAFVFIHQSSIDEIQRRESQAAAARLPGEIADAS